MANNRRTLTEEGIKRLKPHKTKRLELSDIVVPGLQLRISPKGGKAFSLLFKLKGEGGSSQITGRPICAQAHRLTLGTWPTMRLKAAREMARRHLEQVSENQDPRPLRDKQITTSYSNTLEAVAGRYIEQAKLTVASWRGIERTLSRHVLPSLGRRPIGSVGRADIHALLDSMSDKPGAAREALKHLHRLFEFATSREIISANPAHGLLKERPELKANGNARRNLKDEELRSIWNAANLLGYPFGPWIKMLILTGQRRSEWAKARRADIDFEERCLEIPAERYKSRRAHVVPLIGAAWELIEGLPILDGDYLFSARAGNKPIGNFDKPKKRLDKITGDAVAKYTIHDFRSTCKSRMAKLGIKPEVRDAVMGHALRGMDRIYLKHDYLEEKREALGLYAQHVMEIVS